MLRWVALILLLLLIGLQFKLWSDHGGMSEVNSLRIAVKKQSDENDKLTQRNQALAADVADLKHGEQAARRTGFGQARRNLLSSGVKACQRRQRSRAGGCGYRRQLTRLHRSDDGTAMFFESL
jgi:hypothetical protein